MKTLVMTITAVMIVTLAVPAGPIIAATTSNGPYYATPAWDQQLDCTSSANCPRFIVLSNWSSAAVLDRETGLVWEQSPSAAPVDWFAAHVHCVRSGLGNRRGWRLPTLPELASLMDPAVSSPGPALPAGHPFGSVQSSVSSFYWSATTAASGPGSAWEVSFFNNGLFTEDKDTSAAHFAWCVRGGQGVDAQ